MKTSVSDYSNYKLACAKAASDDLEFSRFRRNSALLDIWEHASEEQGRQSLDIINKHLLGKEVKGRALRNDSIGSPKVYSYYGETWSPTTLRYIKVCLDLLDLFGPTLFSSCVFEIGVGYGGQCAVINTDGGYTLYDLPETLSLASRYLKTLNVPHIKSNDITVAPCDLLISNYAFTELDRHIQDKYLEVIKLAKHGYITCNFISYAFGISSYSKHELLDIMNNIHNIKVVDEQPLTHQDNFIIQW